MMMMKVRGSYLGETSLFFVPGWGHPSVGLDWNELLCLLLLLLLLLRSTLSSLPVPLLEKRRRRRRRHAQRLCVGCGVGP